MGSKPMPENLAYDPRCTIEVIRQAHFEIELYHRTTLKKDWDKIFKRFSNEKIQFLSQTLPKLGHAIIQGMKTRTLHVPMNFRLKSGSQLPMLYHEVILRIFHPDGSLRDNPDINSVDLLLQVCFLYYKINIPYSKKQEQLMLEKYVSDDRELTNVFLLESDPILNKAEKIVTQMFKDFDPMDIVPTASTGALATHEIGIDKYVPKRKYEHLHRVYPYYDYCYGNTRHFASCLKTSVFFNYYRSLPRLPYSTSKLLFVPKDSRGPRTICMEPAELQFFQQGIMRRIVPHIEHVTGNQINFKSQAYNQEAAKLASIDGTACTIDFSAASDRVSMLLVDRLFRGVPTLLNCLHATRSSRVELPDRRILKLNKFAPMGSALCFPVMASIIYSITKAIKPDSRILVYGDDLIYEDDSDYKDLPTIFQKYGLRVNTEKSFTKGIFRESCGTDAVLGVKITPIKLKRPLTWDITPESFACIVDTSNAFYKKGLWHLASYLRHFLSLSARRPIPTSSVLESVGGLSFCFVTDVNPLMDPLLYRTKIRTFRARSVDGKPFGEYKVIPTVQVMTLNCKEPVISTYHVDDFTYMLGLTKPGRDSVPSEVLVVDRDRQSTLQFKWDDMCRTKVLSSFVVT